MPSLLIDLAVDSRTVLDAKRSALAAHASRLPAMHPPLRLASRTSLWSMAMSGIRALARPA